MTARRKRLLRARLLVNNAFNRWGPDAGSAAVDAVERRLKREEDLEKRLRWYDDQCRKLSAEIHELKGARH